jgi:hypothetical protein
MGLDTNTSTSEKRPPWIRRAAIAGGVAVAVLVGVGIGAAGSSQQSKIVSYQHQIKVLKGEVSTAQFTARSDHEQMQSAQNQAETAVSQANQAAVQKYAAKMSQADALLKKLRGEQHLVQSSTISQDGVYVVGQDIPAGIYHTSGNGGGALDQCYYATLSSTNTSDILDNNNFNGPETVDLSGAYAFQISGGCTWTKMG